MPNTFRGKARVAGTAFTADVILYPIANSLKLGQEFEENILGDENGDDYSWRAHNEKYTGDVGLILVDKSASSTAAHAKSGAAFFAPLAIITISTCDIAAWNTTFQVISGSSMDQDHKNDGKFDLKLRRYADSTQNTLAATTPA